MSFIQMDGLDSASNSEGIHQILKGSPICIVADNPCTDDFKTRKPFSGTAGQILGQCLGTAGLNLSAMSIIFINPRSTSVTGLWTEKTGFTADGYDCLSTVIEQIKEINPNVIVPLGEVAFQAICRKKGINKYRNSMLESVGFSREDGLPYKVIPTLDPWMATRQYLYRYHIANDFKRIYEESLYHELRIPNRTLLVQPSFGESKAFLLDLIQNKRPAGFDIEVYKGEVSCISFAPDPLLSISIPFDERWTMEEEIELWRLIERYLGDREIPKYLQNAMFDRWFLMMQKLPIITRGVINDTMIKCFLNYPDFPKSLGFICSVFTREPFYKDDGKTWFNDLKGNGHNNINQFYEYNAKDSAVLMEADPILSQELVKFGNAQAYDFSRRLMEPLLYMATRGIKVNKEKLAEHKKEAEKQLRETQAKLDEMCGMPLNVCAPKQVQNYFFNIKGYKPTTAPKKNPKTGQREMKVTTDNKAMKKLAVRGSKEAVLVQQVRALRKLIGTYLNITFDADGRLRCSWNIAGTNTGRLSSSSTIFDTGTNMQNLPKVFKAFLEADEGYLMCEMDKAQAEWVVVAYLCGDANMIRTIENREDAHINTAHLMFGAPKELLKYEDEILGAESDEQVILAKRREHCPEILKYHPIANMSCRQAGKKSNHGLNYDLGANGFAATYGMDLREAKRCTDLYHRAYPSIRIWHAHIRTQLGKDRTLTNLFGRKRRFLDRWGDDLFKAAYAYIPQSTVAQLLNEGLIATYEKQTLPEFEFLRKVELLSQVHDSVLWQRLLNDLRAYAQSILAIKQFVETPLNANGRIFTIRTDAKVGFDAKNLEKVDIEGDLETVTKNLETVVEKLLVKRAEQTTPQLDLDEMEDLDDSEEEE